MPQPWRFASNLDEPTMNVLRRPQPQIRRIRSSRRPRGIAVVMVLGLLAITLAISYATLRGQGTTAQLARNSTRALDARAAAHSGLAAALRKMSENNWAGIDAGLSANVTNHSWYQVSFATGDAKLQANDTQYAEYPFRVSIDATGYAADPLNAAVRSEHKCRCVAQLVRKRLTTQPSNWETVRNYNVYQFANKDVFVQFPVRINGTTCLMGRLIFCMDYPNSTAALDQYLLDLNARRIAGQGDDRPFPSAITLRGATTTQLTVTTQLTTKLGMVVADSLASPSAPVNHPGDVLTYRLYPGGKEYTIPVIQNLYGNPIQNVTLGPDTVNNPLGIYRSTGSLSIQNNVRINGTLLAEGSGPEIQVYGTGVVLKPLSLPALYGSADTFQLPSLLAKDDFRVNSGADLQIEGMAIVWDEFDVKLGAATTKFSLKGNLITGAMLLRGRSNWVQTPTTWSTDKNNFTLQLLNVLDLNRPLYFPDYMERQKGFVVKPLLTFSPDSSGVKPHWHDWAKAIYQPDPADPGLSWEVIRWEDNL
jgi:hypothetical protein